MRAFFVSLLVYDSTTRERALASILLDLSLTLLWFTLRRGGLL